MIDEAADQTAKTEGHGQAVRASSAGPRSLIIDGAEIDANFRGATANLPGVDVLPQQGANVYDILRRDTLVLTRDAVQHLEARLK